MLGQAVSLVFLLFLQGYQGQECSYSTDVVGLSGKPLWLRPSNKHGKVYSAQWMLRQVPILYWNNNSSPVYNLSVYDFKPEDFALLIKVAKLEHSGQYQLEITNDSGKVCNICFNVSIFDPVEKPRLQGRGQPQADGKCQVSLFCLVSNGDNVSYAWYSGHELIARQRNFTFVAEQSGASGLHMYTCNVSSYLSWANHTLNLTQDCLIRPLKLELLLFLVVIVVLVVLFLAAIIYFFVWKKRKLSKSSQEECLPVYEDIKNLQVRNQAEHSRNSEYLLKEAEGQRELNSYPLEGQKFPVEETTIYSLIQYQPPASTSQDGSHTLYSVIQPFKKSGSKKRTSNPPSSRTVYAEVGNSWSKAHNPARLSRKELENFDIYF